MKSLYFVLLLTYITQTVSDERWSCGIDTVGWTENIAYKIASPSGDTNHINDCCKTHDKEISEYDRWSLSGKSLDRIDHDFGSCLGRSHSGYTRYVVRPVFWLSVRVYSFYLRLKFW